MRTLVLNDRRVESAAPAGALLLDFVREEAGLTGTKEACREGECGACTVLVGRPRADGGVDYAACASCLLPLGEVEGCHVVTVEGLNGPALTLVQQLIVDHSASQCGFCTPGIVLSLTGFCLTSPELSYADAVDALDGNLCRCTGYEAIRRATRALCEALAGIDRRPERRVAGLVAAGVLPAWFHDVPGWLAALPAPSEGSPEAVLVAGATDLFVQRPEELRDADLRFLSRRRDLDWIRCDGEALRVGGAVTLEALRRSPVVREHFPSFAADLLLHSSTILRNRATITGNLVNASPIGDMTIILLALDARLVLVARDGARRELALDRFYRGYKQLDLACGELIVEIVVPLLAPAARFRFEKVSNRVILDIAAVNSALRLTTTADGRIADLRLAAGGVAPVPLLVGGLERFLGRPAADPATAAELAAAAADAVHPIDDVRGSAVYKRLLLRQLVVAHFAALAAAGDLEP